MIINQPEICYYVSGDWLLVEPDAKSAHRHTKVASCIPGQGFARNYERSCPPPSFAVDRKSAVDTLRLSSVGAVECFDFSDYFSPALVEEPAYKIPPHLKQKFISSISPYSN